MNRILSWFLIALIFAMSGPLQAASMASAPGFRKPLYGRFAPWADKYAYCSGDPINGADPSGLDDDPDPDLDPSGAAKAKLRHKAKEAKLQAIIAGERTATMIDNHKVEIGMALTPEGWVEETLAAGAKLFGWFKRAKAVENTIVMSSRIKESPRLVRLAEQATTNMSVQKDMDALFLQLSRGNMDPGSGTKFLFNGIFEARTKVGGARLYFRNVPGGVEILGKSSKSNQAQVINTLRELYGK